MKKQDAKSMTKNAWLDLLVFEFLIKTKLTFDSAYAGDTLQNIY